MSTAGMARAVQDLALAETSSCAVVAVYGGLVATLDHLLGGDADLSGLPDDAVLQAARREVPADTVAWMGDWLIANWTWIDNSAAVLDALDEVVEDPFPSVPGGAHAYRCAAQELAHQAGEGCAAVSWAGAAAVARWMRLYGGREVDTAAISAGDAVLEAARRELADEKKLRITAWVHAVWEAVDELATERAQ